MRRPRILRSQRPPGTPTDTGFVIVACRPVARYVGVSSGEVGRLARFCVQVPFGIYFIVSGIRTLVIGGSSELGWSHLSVAPTVGIYTFRKVFLEED
jgi:hypothetical protein